MSAATERTLFQVPSNPAPLDVRTHKGASSFEHQVMSTFTKTNFPYFIDGKPLCLGKGQLKEITPNVKITSKKTPASEILLLSIVSCN